MSPTCSAPHRAFRQHVTHPGDGRYRQAGPLETLVRLVQLPNMLCGPPLLPPFRLRPELVRIPDCRAVNAFRELRVRRDEVLKHVVLALGARCERDGHAATVCYVGLFPNVGQLLRIVPADRL